jgi:hypothetical protein
MGCLTAKRETLPPARALSHPGRGHRPCHSATLPLGQPGAKKPPTSARPAPGGRWPAVCLDLPIYGAPFRAGGETRCVSGSRPKGQSLSPDREELRGRQAIGLLFSTLPSPDQKADDGNDRHRGCDAPSIFDSLPLSGYSPPSVERVRTAVRRKRAWSTACKRPATGASACFRPALTGGLTPGLPPSPRTAGSPASWSRRAGELTLCRSGMLLRPLGGRWRWCPACAFAAGTDGPRTLEGEPRWITFRVSAARTNQSEDTANGSGLELALLGMVPRPGRGRTGVHRAEPVMARRRAGARG